MIVACHWNKSSLMGPALQLDGGSFCSSINSCAQLENSSARCRHEKEKNDAQGRKNLCPPDRSCDRDFIGTSRSHRYAPTKGKNAGASYAARSAEVEYACSFCTLLNSKPPQSSCRGVVSSQRTVGHALDTGTAPRPGPCPCNHWQRGTLHD